MERQIIQIAVCEAGAENGYSRHIIALASDGTVWEKDLSRTDEESPWNRIPGLPADDSQDW